jgi:hypothetical protein
MALTLLTLTASSAGADVRIPPLVGETLAGQHIRLPADISQPTAILIVGFTRKAADQAEKWGMEVAKLPACDKKQPIEWYEMPVLSSVPRLIRPLVIRAIRSELAPELRSHFLPIYTDEASWKAAMDFSVRDDAYIAVVGGKGNIRFRLHGAFDLDNLGRVREELQTACLDR